MICWVICGLGLTDSVLSDHPGVFHMILEYTDLSEDIGIYTRINGLIRRL
jgi:hypothetical protein